MDTLRKLQPWQIISFAVALLAIFAVISYFVVVQLTSVKPSAPSTTSANDLGSSANKQVLDKLGYFEVPANLPLAPQPLQTPDPNNPSTINPFRP